MKERMLITGGNALEGEVRVSGGKNTAVAVIPAMLLSDEPCTIENLPDIEDVHALVDILRSLGAKVTYVPGAFMTVDPVPRMDMRFLIVILNGCVPAIISLVRCWADRAGRGLRLQAAVRSVLVPLIST